MRDVYVGGNSYSIDDASGDVYVPYYDESGRTNVYAGNYFRNSNLEFLRPPPPPAPAPVASAPAPAAAPVPPTLPPELANVDWSFLNNLNFPADLSVAPTGASMGVPAMDAPYVEPPPPPPIDPEVKAGVDRILSEWSGSTGKGSAQGVIRNFSDIADNVPSDVSGASDQQRLQYAMQVLEGFKEASPFFSDTSYQSWMGHINPLVQAYEPAEEVFPLWKSTAEIPETIEGGYTNPSGDWITTEPVKREAYTNVNYAQWEDIAKQLGYTGPVYGTVGYDIEGGGITGIDPQFKSFVDQKRAEGYDFVQYQPDLRNYRQKYGFQLPSGEIVGEFYGEGRDQDIKDLFTQFVLPSVGGYFGVQALGNALAPVTTALTGAGGIGGVGGAAFADLAGGMLPEFGSNAAYSAGLQGAGAGALTAADLAGLSSDITGGLSGIAAPEQVVLQPLTDTGSIAHVQTPDVLAGMPEPIYDPYLGVGMGVPAPEAAISQTLPTTPFTTEHVFDPTYGNTVPPLADASVGIPGAELGEGIASGVPEWDQAALYDPYLGVGMGVPAPEAAVSTAATPSVAPPVSDIGPGIAEGMAPGVVSPASWDEAAAVATVAAGGAGTSFFDPLKKFIDAPGLDTLGGLLTSNLGKTGLAGLAAYLASKEKLPQRGGGTTQAYKSPAPLQRTMVQGRYGPIAKYAAQGGLMHAYAHGGHVNMEDGGFVMTKRAVDGAGGPKGLAALVPGVRPIQGPGTGTSDSIPATIHGPRGQTPARVSNGEAYVPRETVQRMGGAQQMYDLMHNLQRRG